MNSNVGYGGRRIEGWKRVDLFGLELSEFFARFEANSFSGCDDDFNPRLWIPPDSPLAVANLKNSKASKFDPLPCTQSLLH